MVFILANKCLIHTIVIWHSFSKIWNKDDSLPERRLIVILVAWKIIHELSHLGVMWTLFEGKRFDDNGNHKLTPSKPDYAGLGVDISFAQKRWVTSPASLWSKRCWKGLMASSSMASAVVGTARRNCRPMHLEALLGTQVLCAS